MDGNSHAKDGNNYFNFSFKKICQTLPVKVVYISVVYKIKERLQTLLKLNHPIR